MNKINITYVRQCDITEDDIIFIRKRVVRKKVLHNIGSVSCCEYHIMVNEKGFAFTTEEKKQLKSLLRINMIFVTAAVTSVTSTSSKYN